MIEEDNLIEALMDSAGDKIAQRLRAGLGVSESDFARVTGLMQVQPGDLITADLMNRLLKRLARLELLLRHSRPTGGGVGDPFSVLGKPLSEAERIISIAGAEFSLGIVIDTNGAIVQTMVPGTLARTVIGQFFVSDDSPPGETTVNLLVTSPNATGFFKEMGAEAKDIIAKIVYQAVETQIARLVRHQRGDNSTNDTTSQNLDAKAPAAEPARTILASQPAATGNEAEAAASSTKRQASKKASKGGRKAGGGGDAGGSK